MTAGFSSINLTMLFSFFDLMATDPSSSDIRRLWNRGSGVLTFLDEKVETDATEETVK